MTVRDAEHRTRLLRGGRNAAAASACSTMALFVAVPGIILWGLLATFCGCSRETTPAAPDPDHIVIEGRVFGNAGPVKASILALALQPRSGGLATIHSGDTDASGAFRLLVLPGAYTLIADLKEPGVSGQQIHYAGGRAVQGNLPLPDTLVLAAGDPPRRADFGLGRVDLRLHIPPSYFRQRVVVRLWSSAQDLYAAGFEPTRSDTTISFVDCVPQTYRAEFSGPQSGDDHWLPGVPLPEQADSLILAAGGQISFTSANDSTVAGISGEIHGSWELMGLHPPEILLFNSDSVEVALGMADANGKFEADLVRPQPVRVQVHVSVSAGSVYQPPQPGVRRWLGGSTFAQARVFDLQPGQLTSGELIEESGLALHLEGPGPQIGYSARVVVTDLSGAAVWVQDYRWAEVNVLCFPNLVPGSYRVQVSPIYTDQESWRPQWFNRAATPEFAQTVVVAGPRQVVPVTFQLEPGGTISGRVTLGPLYNVWHLSMYFTAAHDNTLLGAVMPEGADNSFIFSGLADGSYKVCISRVLYANDPDEGEGGGFDRLPGFAPPIDAYWYPGTTDWNAAGTVTIQGASAADSLDFETP